MPIAKARASPRGRMPMIFRNGHAAAYSSLRRIQEGKLYHAARRGFEDKAPGFIGWTCIIPAETWWLDLFLIAPGMHTKPRVREPLPALPRMATGLQARSGQ